VKLTLGGLQYFNEESMKSEALKIIDELLEFKINVNAYYSDSEYASLIDERIAGKIKSLRFCFLQMNMQSFAEAVEDISVNCPGEAIKTIEFVSSSLLPGAKKQIENLTPQPNSEPMRRMDRFNLIDRIARHLQESMTTTDINVYLGGFGIDNDGTTMAQSKWVYSKELLSDVEDQIVTQIAIDLGLELPHTGFSGSIQLQNLLDGTAYNHAQIDFKQALQDVDTRPENAIGLASTTLESICKAILDSFEESYPKDESLQSLQKAVFGKLQLSPDSQADEDIKRILGGLINVGAGIGTLRTKYSSFHGKGKKQYRLGKRHARLAINSLTTIGLFLLETYQERFASEEQ
jgi:hypothetical protein